MRDPRYFTLDFIAREVAISKRSVQNYLASIDSWIENNGLFHTQIIRKPGQGVRVSADEMDRLKIEKLLSGKSLSIHVDDNKRRLEIIRKLIILEEDITIKSLSEQFYTSRAATVEDLEWIKDWLASYKLELFITQRKGIGTRGGEVSYRNAIAGYFDSCESLENDKAVLLKKRGRLQEKGFQNLMEIYPEDTVAKVKRVIEAAEKKYEFFLSEDYFTSLLTHLVISISRFTSGNTVSAEFAPPDDEEFPPFLVETAQYIAEHLERMFNIKVPAMERTYICIHLAGFNAQSAEHSSVNRMPKEITHLALELINSVDLQLNRKFLADNQLFFGLCLHLKSKIYRLKKDVYYKNNSNFKFPDDSIDIYKAVEAASGLFQEICGVAADQEEILNISCYFLLSSHRNLHKYKMLLICNDGVIERLELVEEIEKAFPLFTTGDCCTTYQLTYQKMKEYDFIISTEAIESPERPVIDLSRAERSDFMRIIQDFMNKMKVL